MNYYLIKRILKNGEKFFEIQDLPIDKDKEKLVPNFRQVIFEMDIEIFKEVGYQFITSDGIYLIVREDEISKIEEP